MHTFALGWIDAYSGSGHDSVRDATRREYRRLLETFALVHFDRAVRIAPLDRTALQGFVDWLVTRPGRNGKRLGDRTIANALTPVRLVLDAAVAAGHLERNPARHVVLPRRRGGRSWSYRESRYRTRDELGRLLGEIPERWRVLFDVLATTGLRISEALGLRWCDLDLDLDGPDPRVHVRRASVKGRIVGVKSRNGARAIPITVELAAALRDQRPPGVPEGAPAFPGRTGRPADQGSLRRRVLVPAATRAGLEGVSFHALRHTCASLLIESGLTPLKLQRWMGHHSPAFTMQVYGHLLDEDVGPPLELASGTHLRSPARAG